MLDFVRQVIADKVVFPVAEAAYVLFALVAFQRNRKAAAMSGGQLPVTRADVSLKRLHGLYIGLAFVVLLVTLNNDWVAGCRTFFALLNMCVLAYLCFFNGWFRTKSLNLVHKATQLEER